MGKKLSTQCVFCDIIDYRQREILYENELIIIFADRSPIGRIHLQCIPKEHINNINSLNSEHIELVEIMKREAIKYIKSVDSEIWEENIKLGFHIPPFYSVPHLHMHCIAPPYNNQCLKCFKVDVIMRPVDVVLRQLRANKNKVIYSNDI